MKYNFDTVSADRRYDKNSYSIKYVGFAEPSFMTKGKNYENDVLPKDGLCFFLADMDFDCAPAIVEALKEAASFPNYGYSGPRQNYFEAVQRWFKTRFDWDFDTEDIHICNGTHPGVEEAVKRFTDPGSTVIVFAPTYGFRADIEPSGHKYELIPFIEEGIRFSIDWEAFEAACKRPEVQSMVLVQPHNPLGFIYTEEEMQRMAAICRANNVLMIADMVHIDIVRKGEKAVPLAKAIGPEGVVSLTGLAKTFNISGLFMTNMIVSDPALKKKLEGRFEMSTPFGMAATIAAYDGRCDEWVDELNEYIDKMIDFSIDFLHERMPKVQVAKPQASYVLYLNFKEYGLTSDEIDERIEGKAHVYLGNGKGYEGKDGDQWRRICLTSPLAEVKEGLERIAAVFDDLK